VWNYPPDWRRLDADTLFALGAPGSEAARETMRGRKT
jgi:hypothetical protein